MARVTDDLEKFGFNRAVARIRELTNAIAECREGRARQRRGGEAMATVVTLIGPIMPHLAEELWQRLGQTTLLVDQPWPVADPALLVDERVTLGVQVNGKLRGTLDVARDAAVEDVRAAAWPCRTSSRRWTARRRAASSSSLAGSSMSLYRSVP